MGMGIAFIFYSHNTVSDEALLISVKNNVADLNGSCFNRLNRDHIFMQYGWMHAIAGCSKADEITGAKKIGTNLCKVKRLWS